MDTDFDRVAKGVHFETNLTANVFKVRSLHLVEKFGQIKRTLRKQHLFGLGSVLTKTLIFQYTFNQIETPERSVRMTDERNMYECCGHLK